MSDLYNVRMNIRTTTPSLVAGLSVKVLAEDIDAAISSARRIAMQVPVRYFDGTEKQWKDKLPDASTTLSVNSLGRVTTEIPEPVHGQQSPPPPAR